MPKFIYIPETMDILYIFITLGILSGLWIILAIVGYF